MARSACRRVTLEIDPDVVPIQGWLFDADDRRQRFAGWMDLTEQLSEIATATPEKTRATP